MLMFSICSDADPPTIRAKIAAMGIPKFGSLENLLSAYSEKFIDISMIIMTTLRSFRKYWGYLANNVVFIKISTDVSSALKIFETINERGVGLNLMDLLKIYCSQTSIKRSSRNSRTNGRKLLRRWKRRRKSRYASCGTF